MACSSLQSLSLQLPTLPALSRPVWLLGLSFLGFMLCYADRVNMSVAIIAMSGEVSAVPPASRFVFKLMFTAPIWFLCPTADLGLYHWALYNP